MEVAEPYNVIGEGRESERTLEKQVLVEEENLMGGVGLKSLL